MSKLLKEKKNLLLLNRSLLKQLKNKDAELKRLKKMQYQETRKQVKKILERCFNPQQIYWLLNPKKKKSTMEC